VRVLIAPDKFKEALPAEAVAAALAEGVRAGNPAAEIDLCPLADGGEGTGRLLAAALRATERLAPVHDPRGRMRTARWWQRAADGPVHPEPGAALAIIEMAEASGLALLPPHERDPLLTTSYGTGELIAAAMAAGCERVLLCVGGSATVDGGAGALLALGWQLLDQAGCPLPMPVTGGQLSDIASCQPPAEPLAGRTLHARTTALSIEILCDVDNPLLGPRGAAAVFGPQKGATSPAVTRLESGLAHWATVLASCTGRDVRDLPGAGAAGGLPAGLVAALGAAIRPGLAEVAHHVNLRGRLAGCDLCLTGEGRLDEQTAAGKVVAGVAQIAAEAGVPTIALVGALGGPAGRAAVSSTAGGAAGSAANERDAARGPTDDAVAAALGLARIVVITPPGTSLTQALTDTRVNLVRAAREVIATWR
jgi:glycerate kinase